MMYEDNAKNKFRLACRITILMLGLALPFLTFYYHYSKPLFWCLLSGVLILSFVKGKVIGTLSISLGLLILMVQYLYPDYFQSQFNITLNGYFMALPLILMGALFYWMSIRTLPMNILTVRVSGPGQILTQYRSRGRTRVLIRHGLRSAFRTNTIEILPGSLRPPRRRSRQ